jgi:flagellar basal body L-ring protein FlgH
VIKIGDVPTGTTIISLELLAPNRPTEVNDTITLVFQEMTNPITQDISISVRGGQ